MRPMTSRSPPLPPPERWSRAFLGFVVPRRRVLRRRRRALPGHEFAPSVTNLDFGRPVVLVVSCGSTSAARQVRCPVGALERGPRDGGVRPVIYRTGNLYLSFSSAFVVAKGDRIVRPTAVTNVPYSALVIVRVERFCGYGSFNPRGGL